VINRLWQGQAMGGAARGWSYWTRNKLEILHDYLPAFNTAAKNRASERVYIDLMAGQPENFDRDTGESFNGSARLALASNPGFTRYAFGEKDPTKATALESDLRVQFPNALFKVYAGDCNVTIRQMLLDLADVNWAPTFAFLDQQAAELRWETIRVAARKLQPVKHRLELKKEGDLYVIDDAFNSNPTGARNAVETLAQFQTGRKIIVTPGMIELGEREVKENASFGEFMGKVGLDLYILVGEKRTRPIAEGLRRAGVGAEKIRTCNSLFEANRIIRSTAEPGDVILYENDLPDTY
jgi:hypothetical protein